MPRRVRTRAGHSDTVIVMADHIVVLHGGSVAAQGRHHGLVAAQGWYANAFRKQNLAPALAPAT